MEILRELNDTRIYRNITRLQYIEDNVGNRSRGMNSYNCTSLTDHMDPNCHSDDHFHIPFEVVVTLLLTIGIVAFIGNSLVVIIIFKIRRMQTFMNWLILNLAIADLLASSLCIAVDVTYEVYKRWVFGEVLCKFMYPLRSVTIFASIFTLISLSLTRYWAINYPFKEQPTIRHAKILITVIWLTSFLLAVPYIVVLIYDGNHEACYETWDSSQSVIYTLTTFVFTYIIPLIIITTSYSRIVGEMRTRKISMALYYLDKEKQKENRRLMKLAVIITITFSICLLPYHVTWLLYEFYPPFRNWKNFPDLVIASYLLLYLNSALNPINYNIFSRNFRDGLRELWRRVKKSLGLAKTEISEKNQNGLLANTIVMETSYFS